jgi:hypothetical protein
VEGTEALLVRARREIRHVYEEPRCLTRSPTRWRHSSSRRPR